MRRYIVVLLCLAAAIPLVLIGGGIYYEYRASLRANVETQLTSTVLQHKEAIERFLLETRSAMNIVAALTTREAISRPDTLRQAFNALQAEYDKAFEDLGVIDAEGHHLAYVGPYDLQDRNYSDAPWFKQTMERRLFVSDVFLGFRQVPHFIIAVKQGEGSSAWILRATINAAHFGALVENVRLKRTGEAFIINREGRFQTKPRMGGAVLELDLLRDVGGVDLDLEPFEGVRLREVESGGRRVLRAKTWLQQIGWMLIVQQDVDDAFAELFTTRNRAIVVFALGALLVTAVALGTTGLLVRRIEALDKQRDLLDAQLIQSQKLASIGELSAGVAHEINNPLAVIGEEAGWMQDLLKRESLRELADLAEFTDSLREIRAQTGRCREITHKLLSFARKMDSVLKDVAVNQLIEDVLGMREREATLSNIRFIRQYQQDLPQVFSDPSLLRQVLLNIVNNAMDALPRGGEIAIETRTPGGPYAVAIAIRDNGIGIPHENLAKLFDPFFTTKPPGKGTGLGLSICHGIIEKLGGTIGVASQVGQGTVFTIQLPLEKEKGAT